LLCYVNLMIVDFVLSLIGIAFLLATVSATEAVAPIERHSLKSKLRGIAFTIISVALGTALVSALKALWSSLGVQPIVQVEVGSWAGAVGAVILSVLLADFLIYWNHRFQHRFLWRIHAVHHSQTELNAANSYAHVAERPLRWLLISIPLSLVDLGLPEIPLVAITILQVLEFYIHSPTDIHFGPLRAVLVDNRFHRIHHSVERRHFDKNFGICFSIWDRLCGTAYEPGEEWPRVGVKDRPPPAKITDILFIRRASQRAKAD
jgi:sterol desaturase/sphingolipid hydroxylase (fatty acid hydroxylase superfamily)